jgi:hypothetical protein
LKRKKEEKRKIYVKKWIHRRNLYGASNTLLKELAEGSPSEYRKHSE